MQRDDAGRPTEENGSENVGRRGVTRRRSSANSEHCYLLLTDRRSRLTGEVRLTSLLVLEQPGARAIAQAAYISEVRGLKSGFCGPRRSFSACRRAAAGRVAGASPHAIRAAPSERTLTHVTEPTILVLNGPNLNLLGVREPALYGSATLGDVEEACHERAAMLGCVVDFRQSNHEGQLIDWIQEARGSAAGIVINAGAYTHTSVAIMDSLILSELPVIEVHLSNIFKREPVRHHSYISPVARGMICGFGPHGYLLALDAIANIIDRD